MNEKIDLRVKKTYMALSKSFKGLLKTKSFYDITVDEICDNAMVGRGTFYNHFSGKYDFLTFLMREIIDDCINKALNEAVSYDLCEYFKSFFYSFIEVFEANKYNFKPIDNNTAIGIAIAPVGNVYNKLLKLLQDFHTENDKFNSFIAKYLTMALSLVIFDFMRGSSHNSDETKESISFLLDKLLV